VNSFRDKAITPAARAPAGAHAPQHGQLGAVTAPAVAPPQSKHARGGLRALLVAQGASWARDYLALAKALAATGRYEIEVGVGFAGPSGHAFKQQCSDAGIRWFMLDVEEGTDARLEPTASATPADIASETTVPSASLWSALANSKSMRADRIRAVCRRIAPLPGLFRFGYHLVRFQRSRIRAERLIADHRPEVLVVSGYTGFEAAFLLKAAVRRGAGVLRLDCFGVITPAWRAAARDRLMGQSLAVRGLARRLVAAVFPRWTYRFPDGRRMFVEAPEVCIAALICGVMPNDPLAPAPGPITAFTAIHEYSRAVLEDSGVEPRRIHLIGRLQDDATFDLVARAMNDRENCLTALGLDPRRPLILSSTAPLFEHNQITAEEQQQYHEFMFSELATIEGAQVAVSFHPAQQERKKICAIATRYGVRMFDSPGINELLPLATLYVDGESTVAAMAAACGVPMILVFQSIHLPARKGKPGERETQFQEFVASLRPPERLITGGMVFADGWKSVAALVRHCLSDHAHYKTLVESQLESARLWAPAFDGKALDRAVTLVDQLACCHQGWFNARASARRPGANYGA
jgi:hypothetical protein